ncbi:MAG: prolyl oligopeptidase family serine peptidase [Saprospiraceae bacterium]
MMKKQLVLLLVFAFCTSVGAQNDRLTPEKLWELGRVSLQDVSPDGKLTLYSVRYYDLGENKGTSDLYLLPTDGGVAKRLTRSPETEYNALFRPDGFRISYLQDGQIWEVDLKGSNQKKLSALTDINGYAWSPMGDAVLFIRDVKYDKDLKDKYPDLPKANARIIDDLMYRHWNQWHDYKYSNVFYIGYRDGEIFGEPKNIMDEAYDAPLNPFGGMEQISWSADGKHIAYTCKKLSGKAYAESTNSDIYLYELATEKTKNITEGMKGYDMEPAFSPDGKYLAWNSMETPGFESDRNRIFSYELATGKKEELTVGLNQSCDHPQWSKDSKTIYFRGGNQATYQIYSLDPAAKTIKQLTKGIHNYNGFKIAGTDQLVAQKTTMSMPTELFRVDAKTGVGTMISAVNKAALGKLKMGEVKSRMVKTTDGKEMLVWMIYPPDFDPSKKYPALLYCQGGPQSAVSQFFSYRWNFQLMAANDYIIVAPNRRGLPSFGRAWNDEISGDWGGQAMKDYFSAIDDAKRETYIDENRLGAVGASYGGYSVYWLAGNHNKRFKTFISHCGLFNLESWYGTTEELFFANQDIGGPYWGNTPPDSYAKHSPHRYVRNWDTPILVIHGEKDFRVPIGEGMQAFQAAQLQKIPSRFLYFPEEGHWVQSPQNGVLWHRVFFEWLDKSLK